MQSSGAIKAGARTTREYALMMCTRGTVRWFSLIPGKTCVIGRGEKSDIVIPSDSASRRHAIVHWERYPEIEDLQSLNGTMVAGRRLEPGDRVRLEEGMTIQIGPVTLVVHSTGADAISMNDSGEIGPLLPGIVLRDEKMVALYHLVEDVAPSDLSVLILGETGTGKEWLAQLIHERSPRKSAPFLKLNCAALTDTLAESELFGHERGAFTGADRPKAGLFESADGGTVFLDEVGELSAPIQAKLLRVLDRGEVLPVGSTKARKVGIRIVAATNRDLRVRVATGEFRADLFYRLSGVVANVPPLRDRRDDIPALVESFAVAYAKRSGKPMPQFGPDAISALCTYDWPGNVRELKHVVERVVLLARGGVVAPSDLRLDGGPFAVPSLKLSAGDENAGDEFADTPTRLTVAKAAGGFRREGDAQTERERIIAALAQAHGNQVRAARILGVSRRTLINRLDEYGLPRPRKQDSSDRG
jgi:transcriptional regulator with GAF, ATPase, and Fis domain